MLFLFPDLKVKINNPTKITNSGPPKKYLYGYKVGNNFCASKKFGSD